MDELDDERAIYPVKENRHVVQGRPPSERMVEGGGPRPAPIVVVLMIVIWLWVPFVASVLFLVVILAIFALVENPTELHSLQGLSSSITRVGELLGVRNLQQAVLGRTDGFGDASNVAAKLWNQLLDSSPALQGITRDVTAVAATQVDWVETGDAHVFKADMPGLKKEDVRVELEGDSILQISGQRSRDEIDNTNTSMALAKVSDSRERETWHRMERSQGRFLRRFQLPLNSKVEEVQARVENGVLTVTVPKIKKQPVPTRAVQIQ